MAQEVIHIIMSFTKKEVDKEDKGKGKGKSCLLVRIIGRRNNTFKPIWTETIYIKVVYKTHTRIMFKHLNNSQEG